MHTTYYVNTKISCHFLAQVPCNHSQARAVIMYLYLPMRDNLFANWAITFTLDQC